MGSSVSDHDQDQNGSRTTFDHRKGVKYLIDITAPELKRLPPAFLLQLSENPLRAASTEIPVIDLGRLDGPPEFRLAVVKAINSACSEWGFFRIVNHGVDAPLMEEMLRAAEEFFDLRAEEKMKYASENVMSPVRYGTSLNTSKKHALHWRDYLRHYGHPFDSFHLWPRSPPAYRIVAKEYLKQIWQLAMKVASGISESLGLDHDYIERSLGEGCQILAANYYPPCPEPSKTLGLAGHSDHGALTILMENDVDGLQVKRNGSWIAVGHVPGSFVVNIGDYLEILSNGKYKSVEHRATVNAEKTRISLAVGHGPELSNVIGPASPLVEKEGCNYRPITYKDYVRLQQSSTTRGKSALETVATQE